MNYQSVQTPFVFPPRNINHMSPRGVCMSHAKLMLVTLIVVTMVSTLHAGDQPALENIALHKPYTWNTPPDYPHCMDQDDKVQLTDGYHTPETGASENVALWGEKSTVGWLSAHPLIITVDLGKSQPIRGASYNTAGGEVNVMFPTAIYVLVSDDNRTFHEAGELISQSDVMIPDSGYAVRRFPTDQMKTHGRYVAFVLMQAVYLNCDEVEVYLGDTSLLHTPFIGPPITDVNAFLESSNDRQLESFTKRSLKREIRMIKESIAGSDLARQQQDAMGARLDELKQQASTVTCKYSPEYRAILPLNTLQSEVFRVQANLWQALGRKPVAAWQTGLWDPLTTTQAPPQESQVALEVHLMQNEFRAAAFNVSNASAEKKTLRVEIVGLPGGANPAYIKVHQGIWTVPAKGVPIISTLPEAKRDRAEYLIDVPAGLTQQVWLTFHPKDVNAGEYRGSVMLRDGDANITVPVTLRVAPVRFPNQPSLFYNGWDYTDITGHGVTSENRAAIIQHLREHYIDSPWATDTVLSPGKFDLQGNMTEELDTEVFDSWLESCVNGGRKGQRLGG